MARGLQGADLPRLKLVPRQGPQSRLLGPCYEIELEHGMRRAMLVEPRHQDHDGLVPAGVLAMFADFVLASAIADEVGSDQPCLTIELNSQFLTPAQVGRWLYGEAQILHRTRHLLFAAAELFDQTGRIAFCSGIWRLPDAA